MEINTKIIKELTLLVNSHIGGSTYVDIYYDDKQIGSLSYKNELIYLVELHSTSARTLELMTSLLVDHRQQLDEWLEVA